jgi:hypothetical protein
VASVIDDALNSQNPTGRLHSEALARMLSIGRKLKMEIPGYIIARTHSGEAGLALGAYWICWRTAHVSD